MKTICVVRDIYQALAVFETQFSAVHGVSVNEAMTLCALSEGQLSAGEIAEKTGMAFSHSSKVIRAVENKGLIERIMGDNDKRRMYFSLSPSGRNCLSGMLCGSVEIPEILKPVFDRQCKKEG